MQKAIAVVSSSVDVHARAVVWGLKRKGVAAELLSFDDCSASTTISLKLAGKSPPAAFISANGKLLDVLAFDAYWLRRTVRPRTPAGLHPDDMAIYEKSWTHFLNSLQHVLAALGKVCINTPDIKYLESSKALELLLAQDVGFEIPNTYIGTDVKQVRQTFAAEEFVAFKSLVAARWPASEVSPLRMCYTSKVNIAHPSWRYFHLAPAIVQTLVEKKYEVRLTVFGETTIAVGIRSQTLAVTNIDWRSGDAIYAHPECFFYLKEVPEAVVMMAQKYCQRLGIQYCAFDFIVLADDRWVFLEGNVSGQFLFCELMVPETRLLDRFCSYLAGKVALRCAERPITFREFLESRSGRGVLEQWHEHSSRKGTPQATRRSR